MFVGLSVLLQCERGSGTNPSYWAWRGKLGLDLLVE